MVSEGSRINGLVLGVKNGVSRTAGEYFKLRLDVKGALDSPYDYFDEKKHLFYRRGLRLSRFARLYLGCSTGGGCRYAVTFCSRVRVGCSCPCGQVAEDYGIIRAIFTKDRIHGDCFRFAEGQFARVDVRSL